MTRPIIGLLIRNSTLRQVGNYRSEAQLDLSERIQARGYDVRLYDEQGTSGSDLAKRKVAMDMLDDLTANVIQGIGAYDVKRLTRDEFGVDGGTMARRIVQAGGRFITWDREYDLRNEDDLLQFQFQCFIAGIDWRNIRNTLWGGIFKKMEREPMFMKTPLGYMTEAVPQPGGRILKRVVKNPEHAHVMAELERLFDECESLAKMVRILNTQGPARPAFRGRGGTSTHWHIFGLRYILRNSIYAGVFTYGTRDLPKGKERSTVWHKFATDALTGRRKDFLQHVPDLAYWTPAQLRAWRKKFDNPANARRMDARHAHPLLGVLECVNCGGVMIGHGKGNYACSAVGAGRGRKGLVCPRPQILTERAVMQILRQELPRALYAAQEMAADIRARQQQRLPSEAAQRLSFLEERVQWITDNIMQSESPSKAMAAKLQEAEAEIAQLRQRVGEETLKQNNDAELAAMCDLLLTSPLEVFDALASDKQAGVYALLFDSVRIETMGSATARRWRLQQYRALICTEMRITDDTPWGYKLNPMARLAEGESRDVMRFEPIPEPTVGKRVSARVYHVPERSLVELAAALAGGA